MKNLFTLLITSIVMMPLTSLASKQDPLRLHRAAEKDDVNVISTILTNLTTEEKKKIINRKDGKGCTPLWYAARKGNVEIIKLLLINGADVNTVNMNNITPLMVAASQAHVQAVQVLLEAGANVTIKNRYGASVQEVIKSLAVILERVPENEEKLVNYAKILALLKQHDVLQQQLREFKKKLALLRYALVTLKKQVTELQKALTG